MHDHTLTDSFHCSTRSIAGESIHSKVIKKAMSWLVNKLTM